MSISATSSPLSLLSLKSVFPYVVSETRFATTAAMALSACHIIDL